MAAGPALLWPPITAAPADGPHPVLDAAAHSTAALTAAHSTAALTAATGTPPPRTASAPPSAGPRPAPVLPWRATPSPAQLVTPTAAQPRPPGTPAYPRYPALCRPPTRRELFLLSAASFSARAVVDPGAAADTGKSHLRHPDPSHPAGPAAAHPRWPTAGLAPTSTARSSPPRPALPAQTVGDQSPVGTGPDRHRRGVPEPARPWPAAASTRRRAAPCCDARTAAAASKRYFRGLASPGPPDRPGREGRARRACPA